MKKTPSRLSLSQGQNWGDAVAAALRTRRTASGRRAALYATGFLLALIGSARCGEVSLHEFLKGLPGLFSYIEDIAPALHWATLRPDLADWYWRLGPWLRMIFDTLVIAFAGTALGVTAAVALCFPASRNLAPARWLCFVCRRISEFCRSVPELVYALIFVFSFGIGPFAGVLALAVHTTGALSKLFSEVNENVDMKKLEGITSAGGDWFQTIRYAVVPQVLPNFLSYALLRFEINVRQATVIGFVGAGGIGQELMLVIHQYIYTDISAIVLLILALVSIIDISCEHVRRHVIGAAEGA